MPDFLLSFFPPTSFFFNSFPLIGKMHNLLLLIRLRSFRWCFFFHHVHIEFFRSFFIRKKIRCLVERHNDFYSEYWQLLIVSSISYIFFQTAAIVELFSIRFFCLFHFIGDETWMRYCRIYTWSENLPLKFYFNTKHDQRMDEERMPNTVSSAIHSDAVLEK